MADLDLIDLGSVDGRPFYTFEAFSVNEPFHFEEAPHSAQPGR
jgi:hypothetical protein